MSSFWSEGIEYKQVPVKERIDADSLITITKGQEAPFFILPKENKVYRRLRNLQNNCLDLYQVLGKKKEEIIDTYKRLNLFVER